MSVEEQLMVTVDRLSADAYREGYLQALKDFDAVTDVGFAIQAEQLLEQRVRERHERLTNHSTGAAA